MRKALHILLRVLGAIVLMVIITVIAVPLLFKDEIIETVRKSVDNQIEGAFYFEKADVGILRTFPNLCLVLTEPVLTGVAHPEGDSLFKAAKADVVIDIKSMLRKNEPIRVVGVRLDQPVVSIYTDVNGSNYDIVSDTTTTDPDTEPDSLIVEIDNYSIRGGELRYVDRTSDVEILLNAFDHDGRLRYLGDQIEVRSETDQGVLTILYDNLAYLDAVQITGKNDLDLDLAKSIYTLIENNMTLNALAVDVAGSVSQTETTTAFDLEFSADENHFKNLISLLPNMYTSDFDAVRASGTIAFSGSLRGTLSDTEVPVYQVALDVNDGAFQYPGKPLGFTEVAMSGKLMNASPGWEPTEIDIAKLHFLLNNRPFDLNVLMRNPTGAGTYRGSVKGLLDLADFARAYPLPDVTDLAGLVDADVRFDIGSAKPASQQDVAGELSLRDFRVSSADQEIAMAAANMEFDPGTIHFQTEQAALNGSDVSLDLTMKNAVAWLTTEDAVLDVGGSLAMQELDMNNYMDKAETTTAAAPSAGGEASPAKVRFAADVRIDRFVYDTYVIENGQAQLNGMLNEMRVSQLQGDIRGTRFLANGTFRDIDRYLDGDAPLSGTLDCNLDKVYVDNWIEEDTSEAATGEAQYVALPEDISLDLTFRADVAYYDKIDILNPRGKLVLQDRALEIQEFRGNAFGGDMGFSGVYDTRDVARPAFNLKYDLASLKFGEAFAEIETFQALAPIVKFVEGVFNSTLVMEGRLGQNYMPDFGTLSASGFIETLSGSLEGTQFMEKLSQFLNLKDPLDVELGKTRNWFEIREGFVILQEVSKQVDDIEIAYGGRHQIKGEMDYLIKLNIPADKVTTNPVGALAKAGYEELQKKAASAGIQLRTIDRFTVHVAARGKLSDPKFAITLFDASGKSLKDIAAEELANVKEQVRDTLSSLADAKIQAAKDTLKGAFDQAVDSAKILAEQKLRETGQQVISQATGRLDTVIRDSLINQAGNKAKEILGGQGEKEVDKIKNALDKWDPFKKKKKDEDGS